MFYDAHNHLQDQKLDSVRAEFLAAQDRAKDIICVVNGACEADWPEVFALAQAHPWIIPSFGYHPWYLHEATPEWRSNLLQYLDKTPSAVGEIGIDHWIENYDAKQQEEFFLAQLEIAAARNLPVSIHCLKAWGRLLELLKTHPLPSRGFLLHSYGGSAELVKPLADLGAYFSFPGFFLGEDKAKKQAAFRGVPFERLLLETDAPDQVLPERVEEVSLGFEGKRINHPGNIRAVYAGYSEVFGVDLEVLMQQVALNFGRLFKQ